MMQNEYTVSLFIVIVLAMIIACTQANAQQSTPQNASQQLSASIVEDGADTRYTPPGCEFEITFPGTPFTTRRCHPTIREQCELMTGFSKSYDAFSTMSFYVKCETNVEDAGTAYSQDALRTMVIARAGTRLESTTVASDETEQSRMAAILGAGPTSDSSKDLLYIGQIWAGQSSVFTVEGELIGVEHEAADKQFADILRTIQHIDDGETKRKNKTQPESETTDKDKKEAPKTDGAEEADKEK